MVIGFFFHNLSAFGKNLEFRSDPTSDFLQVGVKMKTNIAFFFFFAAVLKSQPQLLKGWESKTLVSFYFTFTFCSNVFE